MGRRRRRGRRRAAAVRRREAARQKQQQASAQQVQQDVQTSQPGAMGGAVAAAQGGGQVTGRRRRGKGRGPLAGGGLKALQNIKKGRGPMAGTVVGGGPGGAVSGAVRGAVKGGSRPRPPIGRPMGPNPWAAGGPRGPRPGRGRGKGRRPIAMNENRAMTGGGYRNRAFGMGRTERGYGFGRGRFGEGKGMPEDFGLAYGMGREGRGEGMGQMDPSLARQTSYVEGAQAFGRGGRGGWEPPVSDRGGSDRGGSAADVGRNNRIRRMRARRARRMAMRRAGGGIGGQIFAASPASYGGGYAAGPPSVPATRNFAAKKMGTRQGAFRLPNSSLAEGSPLHIKAQFEVLNQYATGDFEQHESGKGDFMSGANKAKETMKTMYEIKKLKKK